MEEQKIENEREKLKAQMIKIGTDVKTALIKRDAELGKAHVDHKSAMIDATAKIADSHDKLSSTILQKILEKNRPNEYRG